MYEGDNPVIEASLVVQQYDESRTALLNKTCEVIFEAIERHDFHSFDQLSDVANLVADQATMNEEEKTWFAQQLIDKVNLENEVSRTLATWYSEYRKEGEGSICFRPLEPNERKKDDARDIQDFE